MRREGDKTGYQEAWEVKNGKKWKEASVCLLMAEEGFEAIPSAGNPKGGENPTAASMKWRKVKGELILLSLIASFLLLTQKKWCA